MARYILTFEIDSAFYQEFAEQGATAEECFHKGVVYVSRNCNFGLHHKFY